MASYYEMLAAKIFVRAGFDIDMVPEKPASLEPKKKGENFDFSASRGKLTINVEVTAFKDKLRYDRTVMNALGHKRKHVPKGTPSIIFCVLPEILGSARL